MKSRPLAVAITAILLTGTLIACSSAGSTTAENSTANSAAGPWSYTDGSGVTMTLPQAPERIVAHSNSAAALIALGVRPVGIYADVPVADDPGLRNLDLSGIEILGESWGVINIEKVAALDPDLIVAEWWPLEKAYSGMEEETGTKDNMRKIAPVAGPAQGDSIITLIEDYEKFATSLGADVTSASVTQARAAFETSLANFKAAVQAKPALSVLAVSPTVDAIYVASAAGSSELSDFANWGLNITSPANPDDRGYWETLSWENADKYQPDLLLIDDRAGPGTLETAKAQPTWTLMKAAAAGAVVDWPAFWLRTYRDYSAELDQLTTAVKAADENLGA